MAELIPQVPPTGTIGIVKNEEWYESIYYWVVDSRKVDQDKSQ